MDMLRRPPVIDMTPDGEFRDNPGSPPGTPPGAPPAAPPRVSAFDRALGKLGGLGLLVALGAGGLVLAGLAVLFIGLVLPIMLVAGAVGAGSLWWRLRRMRQQGRDVRFVVVRR